MSTNPPSRRASSLEGEPLPGSPLKRSPGDPEPLAAEKKSSEVDADKSAPSNSEETETVSSRLGSGEDPDVESGVDKNDPEQPVDNDDHVEKSFE